ncbi:MAG: VanZ family protein [Nocardioides sp.]
MTEAIEAPARWAGRMVWLTATLVYAAGLGWTVFGAGGWFLNRLTVRVYVFFLYTVPLAPAWVRPEHYGILLNVALFLPLGLLLAGTLRTPWWLAAIAGFALSGVVEAIQLATASGRAAEWRDVVANACGAALGALTASWLRSRRERPPGPE